MRAKHPAAADEVLALALPLIERYAGEWVHMRNDACRAHAEGRQSSHVFDLRTACLDQRRAGLDALVRALEMADAAQIHDIPGAAAGLPTLERCADTRALTAAVAPPEDERLQARVQRHRERLAEAQVHEDAGSIRRGLEIVDEVLADTEAIAYEPLLAEAYLRKGALELESFANPAALESLDRALWTALAVGHAPVAAQASAKRGFVLGNRLEQHERARAELPVMAALNRRAQDDVDLYAEYLHIVGAMYKQANDLPSARTALESARALREKRGRGETLKQLGTLISLALLDGVERQLDDIDEHFRQFRVVAAKIAAPGARYHIFGEANFALSRTALGRPREAHELLGVLQDRISKLDDDSLRALILAALIQTALVDEDFRAARRLLTLDASVISRHNAPQYTWEMREMLTAAAEGDASAMQAHYEAMQAQLEASGMQDTMNLLYAEQGRALEMLGRLGEAVESFERLQSKFAEASTTPDIWSGVQASLNLGRLRRKLGDYELAERELERALRELERIAPVRNFDHAAIFKERGELAHERQHVDAAVAYLTEAESLFETTAEPDYLPLVRTRFVLAQALTGDGPASPAARARAEAALEAFRAKNRDDEARAVEAWLAEHA